MESDNLKFSGQWLWTDENEIFVMTDEVKIDTVSYQFSEGIGSQPQGYYIRITQLNNKELKTLERHQRDTWNSGFAKERLYFAQNYDKLKRAQHAV